MKIESLLAFAIALLLVAGVLALTGCTKVVTVPTGPGTFEPRLLDFGKDVETKSFTSSAELLSFIQENAGRDYYGGMFKGQMLETAVSLDMVETMAEPTAAEARDFSETNVQVVGVDEADIIKTDGNYIYTVSDYVLYIIKAYPGEDAEIVQGNNENEIIVRHNGCPWFKWHQRVDALDEDRPGCDIWFKTVVEDINKALGTNIKIETTGSLPDGDDSCIRRIWID